MMKIVLIARNGQLGQALQAPLASIGQLIAWDRRDLDLQNLDGIHRQLREVSPDVIVNAAAYTAVDQAESQTELAFNINSDAVACMADYAAKTNALLVHYSTGYVFGGNQAMPYTETDIARPLNIYGHSKLAGENAITHSACQALIFRINWLVSAHGENFIKTIFRLAQTREEMKVVADQHGAPTSAERVAQISTLAIRAFQNQRLATGMYHLSAAGQTTWHGLARYAIERAQKWGMPFKTTGAKILPISSQNYPLPAARPKNSCLNTQKLSDTLALQLPEWPGDVDKIIDELYLQHEVVKRR